MGYHENKRRNKQGPRWGKIFGVIALCKFIKNKKQYAIRNRNKGNDHWVGVRTGGGQPRHITIRNNEINNNRDNNKPVALFKWADWSGSNAIELQGRITEKLTGRMVANSSKKVYQGLFHKWCIHRGGARSVWIHAQ